jgi:hypothetical protein
MNGGLSHETEEVLRRARLSEAMPLAKRRKLKAAVLSRIAAAGSVTLAASEAAGGGLWASGFGAAIKGAATFAVVASLGAGGYFAMRPAHRMPTQPAVVEARDPKPQASEIPPPAAVVFAPPQATARLARAKVAARPASRPAPAPAPAVAAPVVESSSLAEETQLLREADRAVRAGDGERAMALLNDHAARFPDGNLAPERAAERLVVLCLDGKADASAASRFLAAHPGSALTARVKQACGLAPK